MQQEINNAIEVLKSGGIILYPTDTVWGIGCDATNEQAVEKIYHIKKKKSRDGFIILIDKQNILNQYLKKNTLIKRNISCYNNKPTTFIYPDAKGLAKNVIGKNGSVGIRIPKDEFCQKLIAQLSKPIVSTSANMSGLPSPLSYSGIDKNILRQVDYIVNLRKKEKSNFSHSAIIKLDRQGNAEIIRR